MGCLFRDIIAAGMVWEVPIAGEGFAQYGIQGFLDSTRQRSAPPQEDTWIPHSRRFDVPSAQIELDDCQETLDGICDFRQR